MIEDYDTLQDKVDDMKLAERHLLDAYEALAEIRDDGIAACRLEIQDRISELRESQRQVSALMDAIRRAEEERDGYGRPVEE